jgi:hypothetical protein
MYLAYQGLPPIFDPSVEQPNSQWKAFYAVVSSIDETFTNYQNSCNTVYESFTLVACDNTPTTLCDFVPQGQCGCLIATHHTENIPFCDGNSNVCKVGIRNNGSSVGSTLYPDNCYIEVFFVGKWGKHNDPPFDIYPEGTVLASLRWAATAKFMASNGGAMLNCTNHTI